MTRYTLSAGAAARPGAGRVPGALPADGRAGRRPGARRGGAGPLGCTRSSARSVPDQFIDLAEETGADRAARPLGADRGLRAGRRVERWTTRARSCFVSVNVAVRQVCDPDLVADVARILAETGLPAAPAAAGADRERPARAGRPPGQAITALAAMGVRIAIDDFGTGYSNLAYLPRLPLHTMKLAGVFIDGLRQHTTGSDQIVASLISLAHDLGLSVTAEGGGDHGAGRPAAGGRLRHGAGMALLAGPAPRHEPRCSRREVATGEPARRGSCIPGRPQPGS